MKKLILIAASLFAASAASAATVTYNFDTDQSSSFVVRETGDAGESSVDFSYDYSTHVQDSGTTVTIPAAPASLATTLGLRMTTNSGPSALGLDGISVYPDVTGLDLSTGVYQITFDVWSNHNGEAGGGSGSTQVTNWGAAADTTLSNSGNYTAIDGFTYGMTGDGGSSIDYRYYQGNPNAPVHATANFNGANETNQTAAGWVAFFPNNGTNGTPATGTVLAGASGKQWISVRLTVSNAGANRLLEFKRTTDSDYTVVSSITGATGAFLRPSFGINDINGGFCTSECGDTFALFDNIVIDDAPVISSNVQNWLILE
ncbi:MAG: hypothetical protein ACFCU1_07960 [Sumerlaeia bacterium]